MSESPRQRAWLSDVLPSVTATRWVFLLREFSFVPAHEPVSSRGSSTVSSTRHAEPVPPAFRHVSCCFWLTGSAVFVRFSVTLSSLCGCFSGVCP
jgi:hypothetical protein